MNLDLHNLRNRGDFTMILSDFDGGRSLHDTQHFALGQEVYDSQGNRWGYVQINEASGGAIACFVRRSIRILCLSATAL